MGTDGEVITYFGSTFDGVEPEFRREVGSREPRASHADTGVPVPFGEAVLVLPPFRGTGKAYPVTAHVCAHLTLEKLWITVSNDTLRGDTNVSMKLVKLGGKGVAIKAGKRVGVFLMGGTVNEEQAVFNAFNSGGGAIANIHMDSVGKGLLSWGK